MRTIVFLYSFLFFSYAQAKPLVVASFSVIGDIIEEVAKDHVDLVTIVGPNQDAHIYEPRPKDAKNLHHAEAIFINGLGFESWMERLIKASGFQGQPFIVTEGVHPIQLPMGSKVIDDPHSWHSFTNALIYIDNIVKGLSEIDPLHKQEFQANAKKYKKKIQKLAKFSTQEIQKIPVEKRKVITAHDAFGYLGKSFDIQFLAPVGISTDAEPSAKAIQFLIKQIRQNDVKAIFVENISNSRIVKQIAEETGVEISGVLYSDALSKKEGDAGTYFELMKHNIQTLIKALKSN